MPRLSTRLFGPRIVVALVVVAVAVLAACSRDDPEGESVTGEVIGVEARSITEFDVLTIIDEDGMTWEFAGGAFAGFTPSHLREHQALGDPVKVWFVEEEDGQLRVTRIEDG